MSRTSILTIAGLTVVFDTDTGPLQAVDNVSFSVPGGGTLGIVGESGCGKSVTALSVMRLLPGLSGRIVSGEIRLRDIDLTTLSPQEMAKIRGRRVAMIFQEPMTALNPVHRIGRQMGEVYRLHFPDMDAGAIHAASLAMLGKVGIPEPEQRLAEYPHQISGGMRQRIMIAMALACKPDLLIADEPTTALDVTIQAQILELIRDLQREYGLSVMFITHDLGVIAEICDHVVVMYAGQTAETGPVSELFHNPRHPYTLGLLSSIPRLSLERKSRLNIIPGIVPSLQELPEGCRFQNRCPFAQEICGRQPPLKPVGPFHKSACHFTERVAEAWDRYGIAASAFSPGPGKTNTPAKAEPEKPLLSVQDLRMHFPVRGGVFLRPVAQVLAVDGISFDIEKGRTLGLVGESGCGKTTAGRCILRLYPPTGGRVVFDGADLMKVNGKALRSLRRRIQMIFQDPFESLNSRQTVADILEEPLRIHRIGTAPERRMRVAELLERVGLRPESAQRFPHEFSGGQRQRIGIARAIALNPDLIVCDEPVSALDVSIQSQILNLMLDLQRDLGLTYVFISHDLTVVRHIADRIAVMYLGKIVEHTDAGSIYRSALHPYTRALFSAIPVPDPDAGKRRDVLIGDVPSPVHPPSGCRFHTRCPIQIDRCRIEEPLLMPAPGTSGARHLVACHRADDVRSGTTGHYE